MASSDSHLTQEQKASILIDHLSVLGRYSIRPVYMILGQLDAVLLNSIE